MCSEFLRGVDMARNVRSGPLESRTSRGKLPTRNAPYWCVLSPSLALGYRKGTRGGAWFARLHDDDTGKRYQEKSARLMIPSTQTD